MLSISMLGASNLYAEQNSELSAPPIDDLAFLLFLAEGTDEEGEWISELDLDDMPMADSQGVLERAVLKTESGDMQNEAVMLPAEGGQP